MPWMIVEEDEREYLADVTDSAWSNVDILTNRHGGRACVTHTDGSVSVRAYQRANNRWSKFHAWDAYYELTDGRLVTAGTWGDDVTFGWLRRAPAVNE